MAQCEDFILVVDDDQAVREALKFALELEGWKVRVCGSGAELLKHPSVKCARCLVLDYKMPKMDGFEVLDQLTARNIRIPVILITGQVTSALRLRAELRGIYRVLEKPLLFGTTLTDAIHTMLDQPRLG